VVLEDGELALLLDVADVLRLARPAVDPTREVRPRARRILLADDSVTTRQLERSLLEAAGYDVSVAADGLEAWEKLGEDGVFDAIVSDLEMPRLDGFALLARVRSTPRLSRLPVVLVTALASDDDRRRALDLGASAYITKRSFDDEALLDALESLT
jgi:two-component system chemotaxis sensor kinase CheA